jgi:hypothetical protein
VRGKRDYYRRVTAVTTPSLVVLEAARGLAVDAVTGEVVSALGTAGVRPILLKGPAVAELLYPEEPRVYVDSDLLVAPDDHARAERVLARLGFEQQPVELEPELGLPHARSWRREEDQAAVDLHALIAGVGVAPRELWQELEPLTEPMAVGNVECRVPRTHAVALIVALHAAQHGEEVSRPLADLGRAVAALPREEWRRAAALADRLDATINFASGLRRVEGGSELAEAIGLPGTALIDAARGPYSPTRLALGFSRLAREPTLRAKLAVARGEVAPPPEHMRWWSPLARRGRAGLAAAYVWRALQLLWRTPPSLLAWWRSTRR